MQDGRALNFGGSYSLATVKALQRRPLRSLAASLKREGERRRRTSQGREQRRWAQGLCSPCRLMFLGPTCRGHSPEFLLLPSSPPFLAQRERLHMMVVILYCDLTDAKMISFRAHCKQVYTLALGKQLMANMLTASANGIDVG